MTLARPDFSVFLQVLGIGVPAFVGVVRVLAPAGRAPAELP